MSHLTGTSSKKGSALEGYTACLAGHCTAQLYARSELLALRRSFGGTLRATACQAALASPQRIQLDFVLCGSAVSMWDSMYGLAHAQRRLQSLRVKKTTTPSSQGQS